LSERRKNFNTESTELGTETTEEDGKIDRLLLHSSLCVLFFSFSVLSVFILLFVPFLCVYPVLEVRGIEPSPFFG
jgi:hypothetical protein